MLGPGPVLRNHLLNVARAHKPVSPLSQGAEKIGGRPGKNVPDIGSTKLDVTDDFGLVVANKDDLTLRYLGTLCRTCRNCAANLSRINQ